MKIFVTAEQFKASEAIQRMAQFAILNGITLERITAGTWYNVTSAGQLEVEKEHYQLIYDNDLILESPNLFVVLPDATMSMQVDLSLPLATYDVTTEVDGELVTVATSRTYAEYFDDWRSFQQDNGSWLCRLNPRPYGDTVGHLPTNAEFRAYWALWSAEILDTATGMAMLKVIEDAAALLSGE